MANMYNTKILPANEWYRLEGTGAEAEKVIPHLDPRTTNIEVVEKDNKVVGSWLLFPVYHAECVWIHPDHRNNGVVAKRLVVGMHRMARELGVKNIVTAATDDKIKQLILNHLDGRKLPGEFFVFPVGE